MAKKQMSKEEADIYIGVACTIITVAFTAYHFIRLKRQYITGPHAQRIFDIRQSWRDIVATGAVAIAYCIASLLLYSASRWSMVLTVPLGLYLLNLIGIVQGRSFLGVVVDSQQGVVYFPPNYESLEITDYLMVMPALRHISNMDSVPLASIDRFTRQAGKSLFMHGDFGSRRITFTNKFKRDECIHMITSGARQKIHMASELE